MSWIGATTSSTSATVTAVRSTRELETIEHITRNQHEYALMKNLEGRQEFVRDFFWTAAMSALQRSEMMIRQQIVASYEKITPRMAKMILPVEVTRTFEIVTKQPVIITNKNQDHHQSYRQQQQH